MYKLDLMDNIVRVEDEAIIPRDERNRHYREFLEWEAAGNTPAPPDMSQIEVDSINRRLDRDLLLRESDYTQIPDTPLDAQKRQEWRDYRQALRDLPNQPGFPDNVTWPTKPERG